MSDLSKKNVACDGNIPPFDTSEIHKYLKKVDGWEVKTNNDKSYYLIKVLNSGISRKVKTLLIKLVILQKQKTITPISLLDVVIVK